MKWERATIFISSTFNDMHAERDYLVKDVFPELREWCEERKIHLVDVDLRWGVTEEDSSSNHTVLACLHNIDESRPFFLCFLGQRRGWVPQKKDISTETIAEYPDISNTIGQNSVTEIEIEHALLSPMKHIVNGNEKQEIPVRHALFYFRNPDYIVDLTIDQRKIFTNEGESDIPLANRELIGFKAKIKSKWDHTVDYNCYWDKNIISPELNEVVHQGRLTDFKVEGSNLKEIIITQLKAEIIKEFPEREQVVYTSDLERDLDQQALFIALNSEGFISRRGDFDGLNEYITNDKNGFFVLSAPAGYGKSMLLSNFIQSESNKHTARFINRFCGVSDLCSQQYSLWKTIFDDANIKYPDTFKELKDQIGELFDELAKEKTVLVIDAINQLPNGLEMLEWLPKQLPDDLKIILSIKEDRQDVELTNCIDNLYKTENISLSTVRPFESKDEKKKLIQNYLKKYLKALDDNQIDTICDFNGSQNPLYLKILLSELRIFGSFGQLSKEIQLFGETPKEAFNTVLGRLEREINSIDLDPKVFTSLLFGLLANARNGLSEKELVACIKQEFTVEEDKLMQAIRLFIRQVRPFMARREGRIDYFYEAFKLAAQERYSQNKIHYNKLLADYFKKQADPEGDLSFKGEHIRDFNELPYHLKESENANFLEKILSTYLWIRRKTELSDLQNTINDYSYSEETEENYHVQLIKKTLIISQHILKENIKYNLPSNYVED